MVVLFVRVACADPRRQQDIQNLVHHTDSCLESPQNDRSQQEDWDVTLESPKPELEEMTSDDRMNSGTTPDESALPPTLETRKKKKNTGLSTPAYKKSSQDDLPSTANQSREPTKVGSKRKFSPDEDGILSDQAQDDDEFQFSRPSGSPQKKADTFNFMRQDFSPTKTPVCVKPGSTQTEASKRKVLEPSMYHSCHQSPSESFTLTNRI